MHFLEPEGSLPHSQVPATCLYPELAPSSFTELGICSAGKCLRSC